MTMAEVGRRRPDRQHDVVGLDVATAREAHAERPQGSASRLVDRHRLLPHPREPSRRRLRESPIEHVAQVVAVEPAGKEVRGLGVHAYPSRPPEEVVRAVGEGAHPDRRHVQQVLRVVGTVGDPGAERRLARSPPPGWRTRATEQVGSDEDAAASSADDGHRYPAEATEGRDRIHAFNLSR